MVPLRNEQLLIPKVRNLNFTLATLLTVIYNKIYVIQFQFFALLFVIFCILLGAGIWAVVAKDDVSIVIYPSYFIGLQIMKIAF